MHWPLFQWYNSPMLLLSLFLTLSFCESIEIGYPLQPQIDCYDPILKVVGNEAHYMNSSQYIEFVNEVTNNYFGGVTRHDEFPSPLSDTFHRIVHYCPLIFRRRTTTTTTTPAIECHDDRIYISGASSGNPTNSEQVNLYHLCAGTMTDYIKAVTANSPSVAPTSSAISSVVPVGAPVYIESNVTPTTSKSPSAEPTVDMTSSTNRRPVTSATPPPSVVVSPTRSRDDTPIVVGSPSINPTVNPSRINIHEIKFRLAFRQSIAIEEDSFIANKNGVRDYIQSVYTTFAENVADIFNKRKTILVGGGLGNRRLDSQVVSRGEDRVMLEKIKLKSILRRACPNTFISEYNCLEMIGVTEYAVDDEGTNTATEFNNLLDISYERGDLTLLIEDDGGIYKVVDEEESSFASSTIAGIAAAGVAGAGILIALGAKVRNLSCTHMSRTHTSMSFSRPPDGELDDNEELQEEGDIEDYYIGYSSEWEADSSDGSSRGHIDLSADYEFTDSFEEENDANKWATLSSSNLSKSPITDTSTFNRC